MSIRRTPLLLGLVLALAAPVALAAPASARTGTLTNLSHLDFLLARVEPAAVPGHDTYRLDTEPALLMPWTYADARDGGTFERIGGGTLEPASGHYSQGAFNADDVARAAVVYLRHWSQTGDTGSRAKAYDLLRSVAYLQTVTGANRGRTVLWAQADGTLNPSAIPVEQPDPSDSGPSYWQARSLWAFGEGYAAFRRSDPEFAAFLQERIRLSVAALERDVLSHDRTFAIADGKRVPAWLIVDGADATAEAMLGLAAYVRVAADDAAARTALDRFAEGIAAMADGSRTRWPYRAILPWAPSRSLWHAWASQEGAALARAADALSRPGIARPAVDEALSFDPTLLTSDGPDNGWQPAPTDRVQIAYGVDSRVQSLLAVADTTGAKVAGTLAALNAAWFFGANRAGEPMYSARTGVTFDGLEADGRINRNSGAESTIHGLLTMLALDAHPRLRSLAVSLTAVPQRDGLRVVEAEDARSTTGTVVTPDSAWTGESAWSGGAYLRLSDGQTASLPLGSGALPAPAEPVVWHPESTTLSTRWTQGDRSLGTLRHRAGEQGITAEPGALLPQPLPTPLTTAGTLTVTAVKGPVQLDAVLLRPLVSSATFTGPGRTVTLLFSAARTPVVQSVPGVGRASVYDRTGRLVDERAVRGGVRVPAGGMVGITSR